MITDKMKEWLEELPDVPVKDVKFCVYMNRIEKRIQRELNNFKWLCKNFPEIFLDEEVEVNELSGKIVSHRRLRMLLECILTLNPEMNVELVLKRLEGNQPKNVIPIDVEKEVLRIRKQIEENTPKDTWEPDTSQVMTIEESLSKSEKRKSGK